MAASLLFELFSSGLLCMALLLPLYYLLGYGTLGIVNSIWHLRYGESYRFKFEDVLVAALATLSFIIIGCKLAGVFPQIWLVSQLAIAVSLAGITTGFIYARLNKTNYPIALPNWQYSLVWLLLFGNYLIRAIVKARSLRESLYVPSRFNTDVFLYMRRSIVFLNPSTQLQQSENGQTILDSLYNSPKLLSTLIYSTFTYISGDIGIAASLVTSLVLSAIILKYLVLTKAEKSFDISLTTVAIAVLIIFQPIWCWLHDQFYWSNLLCIYLLVYAFADLLADQKIGNTYLVKLALTLITLAGFYPSQLPFFMLVAMLSVWFCPDFSHHRRNRYLLAILLITVAVMALFMTQYLDTSEVIKHFDLADDKHGQKLNYIPFWSFLDFIPRTGGTPKDIGAVLLISASLLVGFWVIRYCIKVIPSYKNWLKVLYIVYAIYSASYLLLPGEYRQSKFFFTYVVPLILFCFIKTIFQSNLRQKTAFKILLSALAIYVGIKSFLKPYKPHISSEMTPVIATAKSLNKPVTIYRDSSGSSIGYYYLAYQLKNLDFRLISGCPQASDLNRNSTSIIPNSCSQVELEPEFPGSVILTDINGSDNDN